jgi:hypothetical protein
MRQDKNLQRFLMVDHEVIHHEQDAL